MNIHKNARLTPAGRLEAVRRVLGGEPPSTTGPAMGVSRRTIWKWLNRYAREGALGLADRPSRPHRMPTQLPRHRRRQILRARAKRWSSVRIAQHYQLPISTVVTVQRRAGLARLARLEPPRPIVRYEKRRPGQLVHVDVKKLGRIVRVGHRMHGDRRQRGRGAGWEFVHVAIDDCTRLGYAEVLRDEQAETAVGFLHRAAAWFAALGIRVRAWMTDNGSAYVSRAMATLCTTRRWRHLRTRPYTPRTNGKAERFIRTLVYEWAYGRAYGRSAFRTAALPTYLRFYNTERRHTALNYCTPLQRLAARVNNLLVNNS